MPDKQPNPDATGYVYDKYGNRFRLPASAEGRVASSRPVPPTFLLPPGEEPEPEAPIDTYCGPVWVGGLLLALLGSALLWCAGVALVRWIVGVVQ